MISSFSMLRPGAQRLPKHAWVFLSTSVTVFCGIYFVKHNVADVHRVRGNSMSPSLSPTFHETGRADKVLLSKWFPYYNLERGDVVSFWAPHDPEQLSIKRVIGLQGDVVRPDKRYPRAKVVVPHGSVWVEGDNWRKTLDSNDYGPIPMQLIDGKARAIVWPPSRAGPVPDSRIRKTRVESGHSILPLEYGD